MWAGMGGRCGLTGRLRNVVGGPRTLFVPTLGCT
jgi:hypothetical protein